MLNDRFGTIVQIGDILVSEEVVTDLRGTTLPSAI